MSSTTTAQRDDSRVAWIDMAKGLCIILVVMMHSTLGVGEAMGGSGALHEVVAWAKPFRMPDFFLVSGLFLSRAIDRDWRSYIDRKVVHFVWFYVLWVLIQALFKVPASLLHGDWAALEPFALAVIEPFGTLWFIYLLPVFFVVTKALRKVPGPLLLAAAAALETARIHTGWTVPDEFAARWVYFLAGWLFAPAIFSFADMVARSPWLAVAGLVEWASMEAVLVYAPADVLGYASWSIVPGISLVMGLAGALAVVALASLLTVSGRAGFIRTCGRHSIVIYLAFFLPMAAARAVLVKSGLIASVGVVSALVTIAGIVLPLLLHRLVRNTSLVLLFERPAWFRLPRRQPALQPAE